MNDSPAPLEDAPSAPAARRGRRAPARKRGRRVLLALGGVMALGLAGVIGVRVWVDRYLRSEAFTAQVNAAAG